MLDHYFISETDRAPAWSSNPLRPNYCRHHQTIQFTADLKASLRAGAFAWPGGYPLYFVCADGEALSFATVRAEWPTICRAIMFPGSNRQWEIVALEINYENENLVDAHTGEAIESAYGEG
jgi:hypothetical protein